MAADPLENYSEIEKTKRNYEKIGEVKGGGEIVDLKAGGTREDWPEVETELRR